MQRASVSVVDRGAPLRDLDITSAFERREQHEGVGRAVTLALVVVARGLSGPHRLLCAGLGDEPLGGVIEADERTLDHAPALRFSNSKLLILLVEPSGIEPLT